MRQERQKRHTGGESKVQNGDSDDGSGCDTWTRAVEIPIRLSVYTPALAWIGLDWLGLAWETLRLSFMAELQ